MERDFNREMKLSNMIAAVETEAENIMEEFTGFTDGMRMLLMLQRTKDGGHNKEEQRVFESYVTFDNEEFKRKLINLLFLKRIYGNVRIYMSANARNIKKVIREMHVALVDSYYDDTEKRDSVSRKLIKSPRHFVMQPTCRETSHFLIDVDDIDGVDVMGDALKAINELGVVELLRYKTKNGWHIVVEPFNLTLWKGPGEVKKDSLLLLSY